MLYEVITAALAIIDAGTRKAAGFLTARGWEAFVSPMIHNLQIMQSGRDTSMVHRRAPLPHVTHPVLAQVEDDVAVEA